MIKRTLLVASAFVLGAPFANGQIVLPKVLEKPVQEAVAHSREIQNKFLELEKGNLDRRSVEQKHIPRLNATAGYGYIDNKLTIDVPGYRLPITGAELFSGKTKVDNHANVAHGSLLATSVLYAGGQINHGAKALKEKAVGDALLIETDKDNLAADVITSFDKLLFIEASEELLRDSERRLSKEEERVEKAIANGLAVPFDRDKIKLARLELESKQTDLDESKALLFEKLSYLTRMPVSDLESIRYKAGPIILTDELNIRDKQEIEALEAYRRAGQSALKKEQGTFLPQVVAFGGLSYTSLFNGASAFTIPNLPPQVSQPHLKLNQFTAAPTWVGGVGLRWEIFGGNERRHAVQKAQMNIDQLQNKLDDTKEKLNLLLLQRMASYHTQLKQLDLAEQKLVIARNNLELADKQYRQGLISVTQRIEAENDLIKAGQEKTNVLIEQRKAAIEAVMVSGHLTEKIKYQ